MGFIAGCLGKISRAKIETLLESYRILTEDDLSSYDNSVIEVRLGYFIRKCKKNYPVQFEPHIDVNGKPFLILGFLCSKEGSLSAKQLEQHEGEFVAVFSDESGNVHIINDRFGSRPFYILKNGNGVYFSSNLAFLLYLVGGSHTPDTIGWFHMFSYGHTLGSRTTFSDVKRLGPGTHLTIGPNGVIEEKRYWRLDYTPEAFLDPSDYSTKVFEAFRTGAVLRSRLVKKGIVALSGGLDSRLVAATLPEDVKFSAFTFVDSGKASSTPDTEIATQVCNVLGIQHRVAPIPRQEYSAVADNVIRLTGGMKPVHHSSIVMLYIEELKRLGLKFLLGGGPGDVIAGSKIPSFDYLDPRITESCVREFCRSLASGTEYLGLFFQKDVVKTYQREIYRSLLESFTDITGPTAAHRITAWELLNRWPAFTFTSVFHNHPDVSEAFCHLDYKYTDLMLKLPAEWLYQRNFYSYMIYHCLPKLRHVAYANTGRPLPGQLQRFDYHQGLKNRALSFATQLGRKILSRKIKRLLKPIPRGTPSFHYYLYRDDRRLLSDMSECLCSLRALREMLDAERCLRFIENFRADNLKYLSYGEQTELIGSLATTCLTFKSLMN